MAATDYISPEELQDTLKATTDAAIADYELAVSSASRWIDGRCSDAESGRIRHFWREATPTQRLYRAETVHLVRTGDFADTTGMIVEIDSAGNGTWTTLASSLWQPEPLVRLDGHPYTHITIGSYASLFPLGLKPRVRVTARWGWVEVPQPVTQACQILAVAFMLGKDVISNEDGYSVGSRGPTDPVGLAESLLVPYMPPSALEKVAAVEAQLSRSRR